MIQSYHRTIQDWKDYLRLNLGYLNIKILEKEIKKFSMMVIIDERDKFINEAKDLLKDSYKNAFIS